MKARSGGVRNLMSSEAKILATTNLKRLRTRLGNRHLETPYVAYLCHLILPFLGPVTFGTNPCPRSDYFYLGTCEVIYSPGLRALCSTRPQHLLKVSSVSNTPALSCVLMPLLRIVKQDLFHIFNYTSGRWLIDEPQELAARFTKFSVTALVDAAVAAVEGARSCISFSKLGEGEYNKAFLITLATNSEPVEVVAKVPNRRAGPAHLTTASEVATLAFCRDILDMPVPKVIGWSSHANASPVGSEYILLERAKGVPLHSRWESLDLSEKVKFAEHLLSVQLKLLNTEFLAFGSLYFKEDLPDMMLPTSPILTNASMKELSISSTDLNRWCIGPTCDRSFYGDRKDRLEVSRGPCKAPKGLYAKD